MRRILHRFAPIAINDQCKPPTVTLYGESDNPLGILPRECVLCIECQEGEFAIPATELRAALDADFQGSRFVNPVPGVMLGCITPEARDLLDRVMDSYREHYDPEAHTASPDEVYQFAYWLIRWSGLVQPASQQPTENTP